MGLNQPAFVGSLSSGVDGSSEGGRLSTIRLPAALVLYSVPLVEEVRRRGYTGKLSAEPALQDGIWVLKLIYEGEKPKGVPQRWHGHRVVLEKARPQGA